MTTKAIRIRRALTVLLTAAAALFQNTLFPCSGVDHPVCLLLPLTAVIAMTESELPSVLFGLLAGLLWDIASPLPDGVIALLFVIFAYFGSLLSHYVFRKTFITALLMTAAGLVLCFSAFLLLNCIPKDTGMLPLIILKTYLPSFILTEAAVPIFYFSFLAVDKKLHTKAGGPL